MFCSRGVPHGELSMCVITTVFYPKTSLDVLMGMWRLPIDGDEREAAPARFFFTPGWLCGLRQILLS
jgi:hypothetical protein